MNKLKTVPFLFFLFSLIYSGNTFGQATCITTVMPTFTRPAPCFNDYFTSITASGDMGTTSSISITSGCTASGYSDLSATQGIDAPVGADVILNVSRYTTHYTAYLSVYIDWNNNGIFENHEYAGFPTASTRDVQLDPTEMTVSSYHIAPPCGAPSGNFRMRVMLSEALLNLNAPCISTYGQAYDFYYNYYCPNNRLLGDTALCRNDTATLHASYGCGLWSSSNPSVATVVDTSGLVTAGTTAGSAVITYSSYACTRSVDTITVGPEPIVGSSELCVGRTITLNCATAGGTWSTTANASISASGTTCSVSGVGVGATTILYSVNGCPSWHVMHINATASVNGPDTICLGVPRQLTVTIPGGTWTSSSDAVVLVGSTGIVTGMSDGTATITYETIGGGCEGYKTIRVIAPTIGVSYPPGVTQICTGAVATMIGSPVGGWWTSGNTSVATINGASGFINGVNDGTVTITYTIYGCVETQSVTVYESPSITGELATCIGSSLSLNSSLSGGTWYSDSDPPISVSSSGVVTASSAPSGTTIYYFAPNGCWSPVSVFFGGTGISGPNKVCNGSSFSLTGWPSGGSTPGIWSSSNDGIATVGSSSGIVNGVSVGTVNISYSKDGCSSFKTITVNPMPTISGSSNVCRGYTTDITPNITGGAWSSNDVSIATIHTGTSGEGRLRGVTAGSAVITYNLGGCVDTHPITVLQNGLFPSAVADALCTGISTTLSVDVPGGTWSSSDPSNATVNSSGVVTGVSSGSIYITYTIGSCYSIVSGAVYPSPSITGPHHECGRHEGQSPVGYNLTGSSSTIGSTWSISDPSIATVSSTGNVQCLPGTGGTVIITLTDSYPTGNCYATHIMSIIKLPYKIPGYFNTYANCPWSRTVSAAPLGGTWVSVPTGSVSITPVSGPAGTSTITGQCALAPGGGYMTGSPCYAPNVGCKNIEYQFTDGVKTCSVSWQIISSPN